MFQKRAQSFQQSLLKYEFDSDEDLEEEENSLKQKQPLERMSKEDMMKVYHGNSRFSHEP